MNTPISDLLTAVKVGEVNFSQVIEYIESDHPHTPTAFRNGNVFNEATQNQGSAKVLSFAQRHKLSKEETLSLFAEHYQAVLANPNASDHQNIRQFMLNGWEGIQFERA
jgi:hypothetical protein